MIKLYHVDENDAVAPQSDSDEALIIEEKMGLLLALRGQGIMDNALLNRFEAMPRRTFLNASQVQSDLGPDRSAPISCGQMQTAPLIVARIISALGVKSSDKILEIGTGSGFQSAILAGLCKKLYTVDRFHTLMDEAVLRFKGLKINNIITDVGDGENGWVDAEMFDHIIVNAAIPSPSMFLLGQLKFGGKLIAPIIQDNGDTDVTLHTKTKAGLDAKTIAKEPFLPMIPGTAQSL